MEEAQWQKTAQQTERNSRQNQITEIDMETGKIIYDTEKEISPGFSEQRNSNGTENKKAAAEYRRIDILERPRQSLMQDAVGRAAWAYWEELSRQNPKLEEVAQKLPR